MKMPQSHQFSRRHLLVSGLASGAYLTSGCGKPEPEKPAITSDSNRSPVPLRVLYIGDSSDSQVILRGWSSISEHPLDIESVSCDRHRVEELSNQLVAICPRVDVAIVPISSLPLLQQLELIVPLGDSVLRDHAESMGNLYPSVRNAAVLYAGEALCTPLGATQQCLVSSEPIEPPGSWAAYDDLILSWEGKAAEPTAEGWLAASFLNRCLGEQRWLLGSDDLQPLLSGQSYIDALEMMVQTCSRYPELGQTPQAIWEAITKGELVGGIAFPFHQSTSDAILTINRLPNRSDGNRVLLDAFSPTAALSSACRQTAIAMQFMAWLSGGEGSETVRSEVAGMGNVRMPSANARQLGSPDSRSGYSQFLSDFLSNPVTTPTLKLLQGERYYAVLDRHVGLAVRGEISCEEALKATCQSWEEITEQVGREDQIRTWKRANGLRG